MRKSWIVCLVLVLGLALFIEIGNLPVNLPLSCSLLSLSCPQPIYSGHLEDGWEPIVELWNHYFHAGGEIGAGISVEIGGKSVVDIVLGYQDRDFEGSKPFTHDSLQIVFSSTKVIESLAIAMLVDRGHLSYDKPVSFYWPEFAQNGKRNVLVSDLMSHGGGVPGLDKGLKLDDLLQDRKNGKDSVVSHHLAANSLEERAYRQKGTQGYHPFSRGFYSSQLCRRVDPLERSIDEFVRDEIVKPLNLDLRIGLPPDDPSVTSRVGTVFQVPAWKGITGVLPLFHLPQWFLDWAYPTPLLTPNEIHFYTKVEEKGSYFDRSLFSFFEQRLHLPDMSDVNSKWSQIESPSSNGFTTATALARIGSALANGGTDPVTGTKLLRKETLDIASTAFDSMFDSFMLYNITYTVGGWGKLFAQKEGLPKGMAEDCLGWAGAGGSFFHFCPSLNLSFAYVMNYYAPHIIDVRGRHYMQKAYEIALLNKKEK
mmetsp:Transcript_20478/g.28276  ORF Transcript_20478/g.28276 Transcript_20478/m.28276 type:complete len:482 (-) Transcript_20478:104-1549(-)|eukprot:CAMPEP_0201496630 /NCGR_PEP_ID=MMETSP0151_2-20130828/60785_1 /ASSEMBLY_ACC=CAM_ASM_000257 /TAXON_ID=200890 /ORGANISM="Paramoeba atlantica, Strain 621/1 / CCAP 1560/9" /LENGTH=481 /DNA_ID=CAMNT_0047886577 /DNA_START=101 /DNA_END=1546 /DNA_ORIENTATION=-